MVDYKEFSQTIKKKYPQYAEVDDKLLAEKMIAKYPQYAERVTFDEVNNLQGQGTEEQPFQVSVEKFDWGNVPKEIKKDPKQAIKDMKQNINNPVTDAWKSGIQGLSSLGVGLGKHIGNNVLRPLAGKQPLDDEQLNNTYGWLDDEPKNKLTNFIGETAPYFTLPAVNVLKGAGMGSQVGNLGLTGAYQGATIGGLESLKNEGDLSGMGSGALIGGGLGTGLPAVGIPIVAGINKAINKAINNPNFKNITTKTLELLTSVPQKYSQRALDAELAGKSLLNGKFDADTAYIPIERELRNAKNVLNEKYSPQKLYKPIEEKITYAKSLLPSNESFAHSYYDLGQKAIEGMNNIKKQAGRDIQTALEKLNYRELRNNGIKNAVNSVVNSFGEGGVYNSAKRNAPKVVKLLDEEFAKDGLTLRDLHRIKEDLYDIGYQSAGAREGVQADVARATAEQINNYLRGISPDYIQPNDRFSLITNIERGLDNENTIARKIKNIGSEQNILSGLDNQLKNVDTLLPKTNKFYKNAQDLIKSEQKINNINNLTRGLEKNPQVLANVNDSKTLEALKDLETSTGVKFLDEVKTIEQDINNAKEINKLIGQQYERNPRLLSNRNDEKFEQALEELQNKTNVNFMDNLNDIRAREALENWFPGQGGGSGSSQGFGNLFRTALIGGAPTTAVLTHNPLALFGLGLISPKFTAKGTIQNLGRINNFSNKFKNVNPNIVKLLMGSGYALGEE